MPPNALKEALEKYFREEFLFDPSNAFFRSVVSPAPSNEPASAQPTKGAGKLPPTVPIASFFRFADVRVCLPVAAVPGNHSKDAWEQVRKALKGSTLAEVVEPGAHDGSAVEELSLRRRAWLDEAKDPALRTVVARPIHPASTMEEVVAFFSQCGAVEEARVMAGSQLDPQHKHRGGAAGESGVTGAAYAVRFSNAKDAEACATAGLSFGKAENPLAQRFLPARLFTTLLPEYRKHLLERERRHVEEQAQKQAIQAKVALATAAEGGGGEGSAGAVKRFIHEKQTLKAENISSSCTWQELKTKLGNLASTNASLKRSITLVTIEEATKTRPRRAFIVCKSPESARELECSFNLLTGSSMEEVRGVCPSLSPLSDLEETYVQQQFPIWTGKKVAAKIQRNQKRPRAV